MEGITRIVTTGSIWIIAGSLYSRMPRQEGPRLDSEGRPHPEWGAGPGAIQDGVWHPLERVGFYTDGDTVRMALEYPASNCTAELQNKRCSNRHYILTGPVLEPALDPAMIEHSVTDHEIDYFTRHVHSS